MDQTPPAAAPPVDAPAPHAEHHHAPAVPMTSLSEELRALVLAAEGRPMTLGQVLDRMKDRGPALFVVLISCPFILLPTTFGLSSPMGLAIAIVGFCIAIGRQPWLPGFLLRKEVPFEALERTLGRAAGMSRRIEKVARPRLGFMLWPGMMNLVGLELVLWGLALGLPGPNNLFAAMILIFAFGLLMRDGMLILVGHALTLISPVLVWYFWDAIVAMTLATWSKLAGLFG